VLGGVSEALAAHLGWPVGLLRLGAVVLTALGGAGALLYVWLWALVPQEARAADDAPVVRRRLPVAALLLAAAALAAMVVVGSLNERGESTATTALFVAMALAVAAVAWNLTVDRADVARSPGYGRWVRALAAGLLLVTGLTVLVSRPNAVNAVLGVGALVLGVAVVVAARVLTLWRELSAERTARVREEQRAEIAAHLHDSVLQTLALIQNRAGASSEVARIARAQERELRDWLFADDAPAIADLATELRDLAATIELEHAVRIDLVTAGEPVEQPSPALVAAAREAMLNAARHAGGDVSVYLESSSTAVDVFVRDRGPGLSLDDVPADRLGIRESIIGRMTRAGGSATVKPSSSGTGTEVHLHLARTPARSGGVPA